MRLYNSATAFLAGLPAVKGGCLITDMRMPGMTGHRAAQRAASAKACGLPAIVITGHGDVPLAVEAMKAGAVDFIEKPFDEEAILHAVQAALERGIERRGQGGPGGRRQARHLVRARAAGARRAWSRAIPTRPSPTISASARARSRSIAPI